MKTTILSLLIFLCLTPSAFAQSPYIMSPDGKYLGNLNDNPLDPNSVNNPIGRYGSPVSPDSINNPVGKYGSPVSPDSPNNPLNIGPSAAPNPQDGFGHF